MARRSCQGQTLFPARDFPTWTRTGIWKRNTQPLTVHWSTCHIRPATHYVAITFYPGF